jgi:hypothetical protein
VALAVDGLQNGVPNNSDNIDSAVFERFINLSIMYVRNSYDENKEVSDPGTNFLPGYKVTYMCTHILNFFHVQECNLYGIDTVQRINVARQNVAFRNETKRHPPLNVAMANCPRRMSPGVL